MNHRQITLKQAAQVYHLEEGLLKSLAVQGVLPSFPRGDSYGFFVDDIELWLTTGIIAGKEQEEKKRAGGAVSEEETEEETLLVRLCPPECVSCDLRGNSRASLIRSLVELADQSGLLYDPKDLEEEITRREEQGSTNIGMGVAVPHTLIREDGYFSDSFVCIARLARPAFFNSAPDGSATDFLMLSCSASGEEHLRILARLSRLCRDTDFLESARQAEDTAELYEILRRCDKELEG